MKKIIKYLTIILVVFSYSSCEEESNFKESDISLTNVYSITEISGGSPFKINVYHTKNLIIEYQTESSVKSFVSSGFSDISDASNYSFSVDKIDDTNTINYQVTADKTTGVGTLIINGTITQTIMLENTQVYN